MSKLIPQTYEQLEIGTEGRFTKQLTERDIVLFGETSGDINPVHFDSDYAATTMFETRIAHGIWSAGLISTVIGIVMPGPGSIYISQELNFKRPVRIGDTLTAILTVKEKVEKRHYVILDCKVVNQNGETVTVGEATVMPPKSSTELDTPQIPQVKVMGIDE
ncbi:MAG: MaoC family dehydratase [Chromatiaceae bacterium]|nr:MaoC family dehydratase [Gammaproteobacteria bacterium]MCB1905320.1 MaoC family dehydratase [Gammaproteobacteria bacterium]MCP5448433.1 MaoC family dehydratase [Chromatiaceae bacterium]